MGQKNLISKRVVASFLIFVMLGLLTVFVSIANSSEPTYDTATVDGDYSEWNLTNDFFADMYRAGDPDKKVESKLYLRYDCSTNTLYALVLGVSGVPALVEPDNAWISIDGEANKVVNGNAGDDGTPPDFAWIGLPLDGHAEGWEASFSLVEGSHIILAHTNVFDDGASQTSAVDRKTDEDGIALVIICGAPPGPAPSIDVFKVDSLFNDENGNGKVNPGDTVLYTVTVTNNGSATASGVTYSDTVDTNTSLICTGPDVPTTSQGTISSCTPGSGGSLTVNVGDIGTTVTVTITYKVEVEPGSFKKVANQGTTTGDNFDDEPSDDLATPADDDPTETPVEQEGEGPPVGGIGDPPIYKNIIAFPTPEFSWKGPYRDFNDDLDLDDCVLRYMNLKTGRVVNTGQMVSFTPKNIDIYENIIVFVGEGNRIRYYDINTGKVGETGAIGSHPSIYGKIIAFTSAGVIYYFDLDSRKLVDTNIAGRAPVVHGDVIAFINGSPPTIRYYDLHTGIVTDTAAVGTEPSFWGEVIAFTTAEGSIGEDLNDDGDVKDPVIRYYNLANDLVSNTGAIGSYPAIHGKRIAFMTAERLTGSDLNNDGDVRGTVIRYYDLTLGQVFNTGRLGVEPDIYGDVISFWYFEPWEHRDLNGDGDQSDPVVQIYRIGSKPSTPLEVASILGYPNPVRSTATAHFVAQGRGIEGTRVQIYDLAGREIYDSGFVMGNSLEWHLMNDRGALVANGVYLYIVTVKGFNGELERTEVRKLVVLR